MDLQIEFQKLNERFDELKELLTSQKGVPKTSELPNLITLKEVAKMLNMTEQGFYKLRTSGKIRTVATGNRVYVERAEFERYISSLPTTNKSKKQLKK